MHTYTHKHVLTFTNGAYLFCCHIDLEQCEYVRSAGWLWLVLWRFLHWWSARKALLHWHLPVCVHVRARVRVRVRVVCMCLCAACVRTYVYALFICFLIINYFHIITTLISLYYFCNFVLATLTTPTAWPASRRIMGSRSSAAAGPFSHSLSSLR